MPQTDVYVDGDAGSDSNLGTSWSDAIKTPKVAADRCNTLGSGVVTDVWWRGRFDIGHTCGNDPTLLLFKPTAVFSAGLTEHIGESTYFAYGTWYKPTEISMSTDSYGTVAHTVPAGVTIEAIMLDWEMTDPSHVTSDGRRKTDLTVVADAATCQATSYSYVQVSNTLHINRGATATGSIIVVYRVAATVYMQQISAASVRILGSGVTKCGVVMPRYVSATIGCYWLQVNPNALVWAGPLLVKGIRGEYSWHFVGIIGVIGCTEYNGFRVEDCELSASVVSDYAGTSANPFVAYSNITVGNLLNNQYTSGRNTFRYQRPFTYAGTTVSGGTGGTAGNNVAQAFHFHTGAGGTSTVVNTIPGSDQDTHLIWDYEISDPYPIERNIQSHTDTPHTDSVWSSYAQDLTVRSMLAVADSPDDSRYGLMTVSADCNFRWKRGVWLEPDYKVVNGAAGAFVYAAICTNGGTVIHEFEYVKRMTRGNSRALYRRANALWNNGSGTPTIKLRRKNCSFISTAATLTESIVDRHCEGSVTAYFEDNDCLFHSNDSVNTSRFQLAYAISTTQVPLYSVDPTRLKESNNFYSNVGSSKYDATNVERDSDTEWQTGADGPHDSTIAQASGVKDARYTSAGTFDTTTESFGASDTVRTTKIASTVTRNYTAGRGANRRPDDRRFGADQYGGSTVGTLIAIGVMDA